MKVGIIGGLISSLLVTLFIQPVLSFLWRAILATGGFLHRGYIDRIYRGAAILSSNPYGATTLQAVVIAGLLVVMFWLLSQITETDPFGRQSRLFKVTNVAARTTLFMAPLVLLIRIAVLKGTEEIADSFTQRLSVLAPAISDNEYKTLKARWASMHGKGDYEAIVSSMDRRATELGVTLPPATKP